MKKIIGLACGRKNGNSETLLRAAARGAAELGVETEIIRAMSLKVLPCTGCNACNKTGKCVLKDDVDWILEKVCLEDAALILSVPCYHIRPNGYFLCIHERMNHMFYKDMDMESSVPWINQTPILSFFWSRKVKYVERRHLVVLIKAKILVMNELEPKYGGQ